jgi:hypothetical protein
VLGATDDKGKPAYTNDTARKVAVESRLMELDQYSDVWARLREAQYERDVHRLNAERLRSELRLMILDREEQIADRRAQAV